MQLVCGQFTKDIVSRLRVVAVGETVTYDALKSTLGFDVRGKRGSLQTAQEILLRSERMAFKSIANVGLERLDDIGKVDRSAGYERKLRKTATRGLRMLGCVENFDAMPNEKKIEHNTRAAVLGVVKHATDRNTIKKLRESVTTASESLPLAKTLEAFKK